MSDNTIFTPQARKMWDQIPKGSRLKILNTVWCPQCRKAVTININSARIVAGDLLLQGTCAICRGKVARLVERDLAQALAQDHDRSDEGSRAIINLANNYGSFMLKNALALSIVLGKEDGDLGY